MFKTPILFLVFNRPDETSQVFEAIRIQAPRYLFIAADGPRENRSEESDLCDKVRRIVMQVDWDCEVKTLFREHNLGCKKAVSGAITWFFQYVDQGIILEDDCLPGESFFPFCESLLEKYKDDKSVISIGGINLGYTFNSDKSYAFSRFMNMWGWATWKRSADLIDYEMVEWKRRTFKRLFLHHKLQKNLFTVDYNWIEIWKSHFDRTASGEIDTWDYQWIYKQIDNNLKSIFPVQNLINNIGCNSRGTHTLITPNIPGLFNVHPLVFPLIHPEKRVIDIFYEENFIKSVWFSYRRIASYKILRSKFLNRHYVLKITKYIKKKRADLVKSLPFLKSVR